MEVEPAIEFVSILLYGKIIRIYKQERAIIFFK